MENKVLIVDDENELAHIVAAYLKVEGFEVKVANDGEKALQIFEEWRPMVVLLDIMLPKIDGIEVCKVIREESDASVIMISAKNGEMDKVIALGIGADDYVTKPFSSIELVARVKAQMRRQMKLSVEREQDKQDREDHIVMGKLSLNKESYTASVDGENLSLTTKEFEMLFFLAKNPNHVFSKEQIYESVWGYTGYCDDSSVTVYVNRIRDKLDQYDLDYIKTVWGAGYKFIVEPGKVIGKADGAAHE